MFLKNATNGDLAEVVMMTELTDPNSSTVTIQYHAGEEVADPIAATKAGMTFPSGEALPQCWLNAHYRISF